MPHGIIPAVANLTNPFDRRPFFEPLRTFGAFAFMAAVFAFACAMLWRPVMRDAASVRWPTTTATVTSSAAESCDTGSSRRAFVRFAYLVDGRNFATFNESFDEHCGDPAIAEQVAARYAVGQSLEIRYDPDHPEVAVVRPGVISGRDRMRRTAVTLALLAGFGVAWSRYRASRH